MAELCPFIYVRPYIRAMAAARIAQDSYLRTGLRGDCPGTSTAPGKARTSFGSNAAEASASDGGGAQAGAELFGDRYFAATVQGRSTACGHGGLPSDGHGCNMEYKTASIAESVGESWSE